MGLRPFLILPPFIILLVFIVLEAGTVTAAAQSANQCINNPNVPQPTCVSGSTTIITCPGPVGGPACHITQQLLTINLNPRLNLTPNPSQYCTNLAMLFGPSPPPPAYCANTFLFNTGPDIALPAGTSATFVSANLPANPVSSNSINLIATNILYTNYGFAAIILSAIGLVALASVTIFGSTIVSTESSHIIFVAGVPILLWIILSVAEGFVTGSSASILTQMNNPTVQGTSAQLGTGIYLILSFWVTIGTVAIVSRGQ